MTLRPRDLAEIPPETAAIGRKLLPETNLYRIIGDHLADILTDAAFAELYAPNGRAAISPSLLALVTIFQFQEQIPDREAAELVALRLDWKYALHLPLDDDGFDYTCLCYFRKRLLAHEQERLIFTAVLEKVKALGFIKKRGKQRTDSLAVIGAVRVLSQVELVTETLRLAVRALVQVAPEWVGQQVPASFCEQYAHSRSDYRLTEAERQAALQQVGRDGFWLLDRLAASDVPAAVWEAEAVQTLRTVWAQRYERVEGKVSVRVKLVGCTERVVTPHDPGVRMGEKRGKTWIGEKAHVTETAEARQPNFITDVTNGNASGGDGDALPEIQGNLAAAEIPPGEQYVDAGYVSGKHLAASEEAGITLMGPPLGDHSPQEFKIADFTLDHEAEVATCPAGQSSVKWSERTDRDGSKAINVQFPAAACAACPLRSRCTTSQSGRSLHINEHHERLEARRAEAKTAAFGERMRARPAIEATLSELVRKHGLRRHRYRGDQKRRFENLLKAAACNLKRLARALVGRWEQAERVLALRAGGGVLAMASSQ